MTGVLIRSTRRDVLVALGSFALGALAYLLGLDRMWGSGDHASTGVRLALLGVACAGQLFRHTAPPLALAVVVAACAADTALGSSLPVTGVMIDVLHVAALDGSRRLHRVIRAAVAVITVAVVAVVAVLGDWRQSLGAGLQVFSLLIVPVWWAANIREHREGAERVARMAELDRRAAVSAERARMARDLHDVVAGHLSAIAIQSEALLSAPGKDPELVRTVLKSVRENSLRSLAEMRTMIDVLRADDPVDEPVTARLGEVGRLVESARAGGLRVGAVVGNVDGLPVAVDVAAYRIVQESLTNALKHAPRSEVSLVVERQVRRLVVVVRNPLRDGVARGTGTGLVSMAERAHAVGGSFRAGPVDGGWVVRAELPLGTAL
ncbi:sensor histidine kinase [Saccharothrix coeruleofusca]|uniref:histidine kinase n=1 Tax=Saccharothrix coeruleofusca TaxID=33919 RepID=A0A918EIG0_9PSEU|nr:histidine kinase [Saccharothrix coeruleofusca]GGP83949.1 two-component sensor histidine kinase [Saccharothrix coeruleofusca]